MAVVPDGKAPPPGKKEVEKQVLQGPLASSAAEATALGITATATATDTAQVQEKEPVVVPLSMKERERCAELLLPYLKVRADCSTVTKHPWVHIMCWCRCTLVWIYLHGCGF